MELWLNYYQLLNDCYVITSLLMCTMIWFWKKKKKKRFIEVYDESNLSSMIPMFLAHVIQFIREAEQAALSQSLEAGSSCSTAGASEELIASLRTTCSQLVQIVIFVNPLQRSESYGCGGDDSLPPAPVNWSLARQITAKLGQVFVSIVDTFVGREIQVNFSFIFFYSFFF